MKDEERLGLGQMQGFLNGSEEIRFKAGNRRELYAWTQGMLSAQGYTSLPRTGKGLLRLSQSAAASSIRSR